MDGEEGIQRHLPMEETKLFRQFVQVADKTWSIVIRWDTFAKSTVGKQLVRSIDSVGANLVEGDGRFSDKEAVHFFLIARGSAREARYWINRAEVRDILRPDNAKELIDSLVDATRQLNGLIRFRRQGQLKGAVREARSAYLSQRDDPFYELLWSDETP